MENIWNSLALFMIASLIPLLILIKTKKGSSRDRRPPGPPTWPIIGNMLDLGTMPHQALYNFRFKYGSVLWLKLGLVDTMVVQSAKAAVEFFKRHDHVFCDRRVPDALTAWNYHEGSVAIGNYRNKWLLMRRLCTTELRRVNETIAVRRKCIDNMIRWIEEDSARSRADILEPGSEEGCEFFDAMKGVMEFAGKPNIADFFPFLKWFDPLRIKRNMVRDIGRATRIVTGIMKERIEQKQLGFERVGSDLLDIMLESVGDGKDESDKISDKDVTIVIMEMFFAGSETTSITMEWIMTELLRNPQKMAKVKEEIDQIIGTKKVEESDIDDLQYLQAVVKESLRLHPPVPLLLPRNSMENCDYMGYLIPKNTQVFVNVWAIGRDPESWNDPLSFKPERFLDKSVEYKGQHFELIPFGSGRRICPGLQLGQRVIHLALASMIQCFDWELEGNVDSRTMDMNERAGITLKKLVPLKVIPKKRTTI